MSLVKRPNFPAIFTRYYLTIRNYDRDLTKELSEWDKSIDSSVNGGLSFADNFDCSIITVTTHATPGTEFSTTHDLGRAPVYYMVMKQDKAGSIYDGVTANTTTTVYFKSDVASCNMTLVIF